jgi:hypothetical protein
LLTIEFEFVTRRTRQSLVVSRGDSSDAAGPPHRLAQQLALAYHLDRMVRDGSVNTYRELARRMHISRARLFQIIVLLNLAPSIQEYIAFLLPGEWQFMTEAELRIIARELNWDRQREMFVAAREAIWHGRTANAR